MNIRMETEKIISEDSLTGVALELHSFVNRALDENAVTIYEAFELKLMSDSYLIEGEINPGFGKKTWTDSLEVYLSMNLALMAKLFGEEELYRQLCGDAERRLDLVIADFKDENGNLPKDWGDYILDDLSGFLSGDLEHMEKLSYVRKHTNRHSKNKYHFERFPYDFLKYEDELIKILKGEADHYNIDKTISPEICDMMTAVELRALELD